jgi:LacI family transcriptional regulator
MILARKHQPASRDLVNQGHQGVTLSGTVTLSHVARAAGVSPSTVSRILNGTAQVTADKRARVEEAIRKLGYQPNVMARGLASGRSMSVGVLTQDISSPYYGEAVAGIERALSGSHYHPLVVSGHWRPEQEREALDVLLGRQIDALIVLGGLLAAEHLRGVSARMPIVVVGREVQGLEARCMRVDNAQGAYLAARHLLGLGHRRIAYIAGPSTNTDAVERREGFRRALGEAGLAPDPNLVVEGDFTEQSGLLSVEALFARAALFTAVMAANDQMAYGARLALYRRGIRVPEDVSLVGFDDLFGSSYTTPPLTTVRQSMEEMGSIAATAILGLLRGETVRLASFMPVTLVIRESTAMVRGAGLVPVATFNSS